MIWLARLFSPVGSIVAGVAAFASLVVVYTADQRRIGARTHKAAQEKLNVVAQNKAEAAAHRSRDLAARGVRDPYTRQD